MSEKPDFIISNGISQFGVEHQLILNENIKRDEGFYDNLCEKVEEILRADSSIPNILVNLYWKSKLSYKINNKNEILSQLASLVKDFILTSNLADNDIVSHAYKMKHSRISVNANFGAYCQCAITKELILESILKKEKRILEYKQNTGLPQWLVLTIGTLGKSSYEVSEPLRFDLTTDFHKVFLYEDFENNLYELK